MTGVPPPPPRPPADREEALLWLRLIRSPRVGPATFFRLLAEHGDAEGALRALPGIAAASGVQGYVPCPEGVARAEAAAGRKAGARLLAYGGADYPPALTGIADAPPILWALGDASLTARPSVAVVGARSASSLGLRMARALARGLAEAGVAVVSGLARGIDAAAHEAALPGTIAVVAGGVDHVYPAENAALHARIAAEGLILSEHPPGMDPQARHFPRRNRIVSGMARAVVVVEAAAKSGSLGTARLALDQGREVMAVPGHPMDARAAGCLMLIRDGATLVRGAEDVLAALGLDAERRTGAPAAATRGRAAFRVPDPSAPPPSAGAARPPPAPDPAPARPGDRAVRERILSLLGPSPLAEDQLIRDLGLPPARVSQDLLALELDGRVERRPGGLLALAG